MFELSIETCLPCLYGFEIKQDITSSLLAELRQYWPSCSVSAEFITHMIRTAFAMYTLYY